MTDFIDVEISNVKRRIEREIKSTEKQTPGKKETPREKLERIRKRSGTT